MSLLGAKGGKALSSVLCEICGNDNLPQARFCYYCGSRLGVTDDTLSPKDIPVYPVWKSQARVDYVGFGLRLLAAILDWLIIAAVILMLYFILHFAISSVFIIFVTIFLYFWLLTGLKGQTVGKMAVGIKVINRDGSLPGLVNAALREIIGKIISTLVLFSGFLWIMGDNEERGWHDYLAQTYVVTVKSGSS